MPNIYIPWGAWYGDKIRTLSFPENWDVEVCGMQDAIDIGDTNIREALLSSGELNQAIASAPRNKSVVICVDDLSRPTPTYRILPILSNMLQSYGYKRNQIIILMAIGAHRVMTRNDFIRKLGIEIVRSLDIRNHSAFSNLAEIETIGEKVKINRTFLEAGLKIGIGCLMPHSEAGFSGGAKIVFPGLAGIDSIEAWHRRLSPLENTSINLSGVFQNNPMR